MILCPTKAERTTKGRMRITSRHKKPDFCAFSSALLCNKAATFSFLDKVFGTAHSPHRRGGVSATSKTMHPFRFVADGVVSSALLRRPAELTTITASRYCARASRPPQRGGEYDALKFRPNGNIIDIWLRLRRPMPFVAENYVRMKEYRGSAARQSASGTPNSLRTMFVPRTRATVL